jgi:hypothetical protein
MRFRIPAAVALSVLPACGEAPRAGDASHDSSEEFDAGTDGPDAREAENTAAVCRDGIDNDGDGEVDCDDEECREFVFCAFADADAEGDVDAEGSRDRPNDEPDVPADDGGPPCLPDDACGPSEICGDGLDNDCDGDVDDVAAGCTCTYGDVQSCFTGPPGRRGLGGCVDGWQACGRDGSWGTCREGLWPADEIADGKDNDCDGCTDEGFATAPTIACPNAFDTGPGKWFVLRCEDFCVASPGEACDCSWSVVPPEASGTVEVSDPHAETTRMYVDASGSYVVTATIVDARLDTHPCSFVVLAIPAGLHVDLWWDDPEPLLPGDVDLHIHRDPPRNEWFIEDDCFWQTCGGRDGTYTLDWGYPDTPLADCPDLPEDRSWWDFVPRGGCPNPRLTLESQTGALSEMTSLDAPRPGDRFRVMAHYYSDGAYPGRLSADAHVRLVCGGRPVGQFGPVMMWSNDFGSGDIWRVADVEILAPDGDCTVTPLGTPDAPDVRDDFSRDEF